MSPGPAVGSRGRESTAWSMSGVADRGDHPDGEQQRRGDRRAAPAHDAQHRPRLGVPSPQGAARVAQALDEDEVVRAHRSRHRQRRGRALNYWRATGRRPARGSSRRGCRAARRGSPARPPRPGRGCRCRRPRPRSRCRTGTCRIGAGGVDHGRVAARLAGGDRVERRLGDAGREPEVGRRPARLLDPLIERVEPVPQLRDVDVVPLEDAVRRRRVELARLREPVAVARRELADLDRALEARRRAADRGRASGSRPGRRPPRPSAEDARSSATHRSLDRHA